MNKEYDRTLARAKINAAMKTAADIKAAGGTDDDAVKEAILTARSIKDIK